MAPSLRAVIAAALLVPAAVAAAAAPASAAPPERVVERLAADRISGAEVAEAARATSPAEARAAVGQHVAAQARAGRLVDAKAVRAALVGGGTVTWEGGSTVDELRVGRTKVTAADEQGETVELALIGGEDEQGQAAQPGSLVGAGMTGSSSFSGGTRLANYCQTWTVSGNNVTGCVEKFKPTNDGSSSRDYYAYNRWGTAQGKVVDWALDYKVTKFDMRSRPRAGYASRTVGMNDYFPNDASQLCAEGGSASVGVGSLSVSIGLTNCSEKYPVPNATTKTMGLVYDAGAVFESRTKGVDYEQEVFGWQGEPSPSLGFYNYGKFCQGSYLTCSGTTGLDGW